MTLVKFINIVPLISCMASSRIAELEEELRTTKYNKRTQRSIGLLKAKIAKLKDKEIKRSSGGKKGEGYSVRKTGDGTVVLLGFPSVGKSTLLNALTNADSPVGHYAFTTLSVIPGLLEYGHAKIQILDVPGIVSGAAAGTGRGKEVLQVIRTADLVLILLDIFHLEHFDAIVKEVNEVNVRMNQHRPDVRITKKARGGIHVGRTVETQIDDETIKAILGEFRIANADVLIRTPINEDEFIDIVESNKVYLPALTVITKVDMASTAQVKDAKRRFPDAVFISAEKGTGIEKLKKAIYDKLSLIRIYLKEYGKKADLDEPLIIHDHATLKQLCEKLHKDFVRKFRFARIWGKSVKFNGQKVLKLNHNVRDGDIVEIRVS